MSETAAKTAARTTVIEITSSRQDASRSSQTEATYGRIGSSALILTLHGVGDAPEDLLAIDPSAVRYMVSTRSFEQVIGALSADACSTVSDFVVRGGVERTILTFDDGLASDFEIALPSLLARSFSGTFFVTTSNVGKPGYVSVKQLRRMLESGMEIGSHGLTHRYLVTMRRPEVIREICESKDRLEQQLGVRIVSFAPVGGHFSRWMLDVARQAGYCAFATMIPGRAKATGSFAVLRRNHVQSHYSPAYLSRLVRGDRQTLLVNWLRYSLLRLPKVLLGMRSYDRLRSRILRSLGGTCLVSMDSGAQ